MVTGVVFLLFRRGCEQRGSAIIPKWKTVWKSCCSRKCVLQPKRHLECGQDYEHEPIVITVPRVMGNEEDADAADRSNECRSLTDAYAL